MFAFLIFSIHRCSPPPPPFRLTDMRSELSDAVKVISTMLSIKVLVTYYLPYYRLPDSACFWDQGEGQKLLSGWGDNFSWSNPPPPFQQTFIFHHSNPREKQNIKTTKSFYCNKVVVTCVVLFKVFIYAYILC